MGKPSVVVLGGGLAGVAAAHSLRQAGWSDITIVEHGRELGGLAGTFEQAGNFYPLAYHHILSMDRTLLYFLDQIGALPDVRWRRIRMYFRLGNQFYDLARPIDFLRFPMGIFDKLRFVRLMAGCFMKSDWSDWADRSAAELVDSWGAPGVREVIFERLSRLKFDMPCSEVSGAWLGARLHFREGSAPLGYIPGANWTKVLSDGLTELLRSSDVDIRLGTDVVSLSGRDGRIEELALSAGETLRADAFVSAIPTEIYLETSPSDETPHLREVEYTAIVSAICVQEEPVEPDFYWMNLADLDCSASGIFLLNSLNPSIGAPGQACVNFVTHVRSREHEYFRRSDDEILGGYLKDYRRVFGRELRPLWTKISRLGRYSPVFSVGYHNPPVKSSTWRNVYFAGNYRAFPSIASTGTAMHSGLGAARALLRDHGDDSALLDTVEAFRLRSMPRE